jgi:CheY-like chemotaxis protein
MGKNAKLRAILLVEDNEDHVEHTLDALEEAGVHEGVRVVGDGQSALDYMRNQGEFEDLKANPRPGLILLDVKLPKLGGFEVLESIKSDPDLKKTPVIMLTTTGNKEDIERGARLGANDYIVKPVEFETFYEKVRALGFYWASVSDMTGQ